MPSENFLDIGFWVEHDHRAGNVVDEAFSIIHEKQIVATIFSVVAITDESVKTHIIILNVKHNAVHCGRK